MSQRNEKPRSRIASQIQEAREGRSWTLRDLSRRVGRDPARLSEIETGRANPSLDNLLDIADALAMELVFVPRERLPAVHAAIAGDVHAEQSKPEPPSVLDELLIPDEGFEDEEPRSGPTR